jgi:cystinosin
VSPEPTVRFNDFAFAAHALLLCMTTYSQFFPSLWGFKVGARQRSSRVVLGVFWGSIVAVLIVIAIVRTQSHDGGYDPESWAWIDVVSKLVYSLVSGTYTTQIYSFGYIKLIVTVIKYIPQAYANYKRKSTVGWSIVQIFLDFAGGITSILQLVIDTSLQADWSGITGNPVKFGLGNISIMFDVIFMTQHFV